MGTIVIKGKLSFGHHTFISVGPDGYLEIGDKSTFSHNVKLICENKIVFGDKSRVSWGCTGKGSYHYGKRSVDRP